MEKNPEIANESEHQLIKEVVRHRLGKEHWTYKKKKPFPLQKKLYYILSCTFR